MIDFNDVHSLPSDRLGEGEVLAGQDVVFVFIRCLDLRLQDLVLRVYD